MVKKTQEIKFRVIPNKLSNLAKSRLRRSGLPVKADVFTVVAIDDYEKVKEKHVYGSAVEATKAKLAERLKARRGA